MMTRIPLAGHRRRSRRASGRCKSAKDYKSVGQLAAAAGAPTSAGAGSGRPKQAGPLCGLLDASSEWICILDSAGRILFVNEGSRSALEGMKITCLPGGDWAGSWAGASRMEARRAVRAATAGKSVRFTACRLSPDGVVSWWDILLSPLPGASGASCWVTATARDVTDRKLAEEALHWSANHDPVTTLPNRRLFQQQLEWETAKSAAWGEPFGLLLLDLDGFKWVDGALGLEAQDALMCAIASRLRAGLRRNDFAARCGDDEFALILNGIATDDDLTAAAEAIFDRLNEPLFHEGRRLECQATIGAGIFPRHGPGRLELMKNAETALCAARETGPGTVRVFEAEMRSRIQRRDSMISLARYALREERLAPFYQPKVDLRDGALYGFEALLRWTHPTKGIQLPETIETAFQDDRLAVSISDRMIELVLRDMRQWLDQGLEFGHVAVNAAAAEFRRGEFAERLLGQLHAAGIPPALFQLEVTETVFLGRGAEHVVRALRTMSAAGIQIALDDFGTGFACLSHLKQFPVGTIKIDRSFIRDLHEDAGDEAIVRALVGLGQNLGINVVAEGIETPAQSAYLRKHLCAYGQGYLFGAAEAAEAVPATIERLAEGARTRLMITPGQAPVLTLSGSGTTPARIFRNIYIVDDECEVRDSIQFMLETLGYRCRSFARGADFLDTLLDLEPGCILLDVRMDGLSGLQVLHELKWMSVTWPVIVISGHFGSTLGAVAMAAGARAVLAKPFDDLELEGILAAAFQSLSGENREFRQAEAGLADR